MTDGTQVSALFPNGVAGVIRWSDGAEALEAARTAAGAGIGSVEITSGTPDAFRSIRRLRDEFGSACAFGAGTVTDRHLAELAVEAGAQYLVTPYLVPEIAPVTTEAGVLLVMGAMTPTEIAAASALGAGLVKVFPADPIGGPGYIRAVRGPMPDVPLWVSGGVRIDDVGAYLSAGAQVVGLTNDLFRPELVRGHDWETLAELCRRARGAAAVPA